MKKIISIDGLELRKLLNEALNISDDELNVHVYIDKFEGDKRLEISRMEFLIETSD